MRPSNKPGSIEVNSRGSYAFDSSVLDQLACPACLGNLKLAESELICAACDLAYPIVDGIPVLISECAEKENPSK